MWWYEGRLQALQPGDTPHEIRSVEYQDFLRRDWPVSFSASALIIDRQSFERAQGWTMDLWPADDLDFVLRVSDCGRTIQILAPPTVFRRMHTTNTVHDIPPFIRSLGKIIRKERAGEYPGGERWRRERRALIGAKGTYWVIRAVRLGMFGQALKFFARHWPLIWVAVTRKMKIMLKGRQPYETIKL
jgi:hypothetical protein